MPWAPMWAVTAVPYLRQPPPATFDQAWRRATVLPREWAVTVMTRVAFPVLKCSGSGAPRWTAGLRGAGAGDAAVRTGVARRAGGTVLRGAVVAAGGGVGGGGGRGGGRGADASPRAHGASVPVVTRLVPAIPSRRAAATAGLGGCPAWCWKL